MLKWFPFSPLILASQAREKSRQYCNINNLSNSPKVDVACHLEPVDKTFSLLISKMIILIIICINAKLHTEYLRYLHKQRLKLCEALWSISFLYNMSQLTTLVWMIIFISTSLYCIVYIKCKYDTIVCFTPDNVYCWEF